MAEVTCVRCSNMTPAPLKLRAATLFRHDMQVKGEAFREEQPWDSLSQMPLCFDCSNKLISIVVPAFLGLKEYQGARGPRLTEEEHEGLQLEINRVLERCVPYDD